MNDHRVKPVAREPGLEELKQRIASLPPLKRSQILRHYPHLASKEVDNEPLEEVIK